MALATTGGLSLGSGLTVSQGLTVTQSLDYGTGLYIPGSQGVLGQIITTEANDDILTESGDEITTEY